MKTYVIGETQGCYKELQLLLEKINYNEKYDKILFTGNYTNGKNSIQLINYIKNMGKNTIPILGKHDITLLELVNNKNYIHNTSGFKDILTSNKKIQIINWIQNLPLLYFDKKNNTIIIHAGIYPFWSINKTIIYTKKIESLLRTEKNKILLKNIYSNNLNIWNNNYNIIQKYQFIINTLTNMKICNNKGYLNTKFQGSYKNIPKNFKPWFMINEKILNKINIIFGNWKELSGITNKKNITSINTATKWGLYLSAIHLESGKRYYIKRL